jgi:hypothetical protein
VTQTVLPANAMLSSCRPTGSPAAETKTVEELTGELGDAREILVHRKMTCVEHMYLRFRQVRGIGGGLSHFE